PALDLAGGGQLEPLGGPPLALELQLLFRLSHLFVDPPPHPSDTSECSELALTRPVALHSDVSPHVGGGIAGFIRYSPCPRPPPQPEPWPQRGSGASSAWPGPWPPSPDSSFRSSA